MRPPLLVLASQARGAIVVGFALALAVVLLPTPLAPPARHLAAELRALLILYPLAVTALLLHIRNRCPHRVRALMGWFVLALALRLVLLCALNLMVAEGWPWRLGGTSPDTVSDSLWARCLLALATGRDYGHWPAELLAYSKAAEGARAVNQALTTQAALAAGQLRWLDSLVFVVAGWIWLLRDTSVLALCLPNAFAGAFVAVQGLLVFERLGPRWVARWLALWLLIGPSFIGHSVLLGKDLPTACAVLYLVDLEVLPTARPRVHPLWWLVILLPLILLRPPAAVVVASCVAWLRLRPRLPGRYAWLADLALAVEMAVFLVGAAAASRTYAQTLAAVPLSAFCLPMVRWSFVPGVLQTPVNLLDRLTSWFWLPVGPMIVAALVQVRRGRLRPPPGLLGVMAVFLTFACMRYPLTISIVRFRLPVEPFLFWLALAGFDAARASRAERWRYVSLVAWLVLANVALQAAAVMLPS